MKRHAMIDKAVECDSGVWSFDQACDVLVLGLGTAGAIAAIAAGRQGMRVIGVEALTHMGGIGTGGGIHHYHWGTTGGLQDEVDQRCQDLHAQYCSVDPDDFHPDVKKYVLEDLALEAGAALLYGSVISAVFVADQCVRGVEIMTPQGMTRIETRFVIDASGDAHAAAMAGCAARFGRESDDYPQPFSFVRGEQRANGALHGKNFDAGYVDPRDPADMSRATVFANAMHAQEQYTEKDPIHYIAPQMGLREGRFIIGEDTVTFADVINERRRDDLVMQTWSHHDNHCSDWAFESDASQDWAVVADLFRRGQVTDIPPGIFIPKNWDGILIAGRCVSLDHDSHQGIRMQRDMQKFGEICATMAAQAIAADVPAKDLPIEPLQQALMHSGCLPAPEERLQPLPWLTDKQQIKAVLAEQSAGEAIWACRRLGENIREDLWQWAQSSELNVRRHAAYALGLLRDERVVPILEDIVATNETEMPMTHNYERRQHRYAAVYLLGVFAQASSIPALIETLRMVEDNAVSASQLLMALLRIADANAEHRATVLEQLRACFSVQCTHTMTIWNNKAFPKEMHQYFRITIKRFADSWGLSWDLDLQPLDRREALMLKS